MHSHVENGCGATTTRKGTDVAAKGIHTPRKRQSRVLTKHEVAQFITDIPNLAAQWRSKEAGGVRRFRADEIATKVAEAFQEAGYEVRSVRGL
jgi:hypothetical protein